MKNDEIQLIDRFAQHDEQGGFTALVERYVDVAYSAAYGVLGKEDLARDACQLTFIRFHRKAVSLSSGVQLGGWFYSTARHVALTLLRAELRRQKREQTFASAMKQHPVAEVEWSQRLPELHEALGALNAADRDLIVQRFFQHRSLAEVGEVLGVSSDAARMRLNRALKRMEKQLARRGITSTAAALTAALSAHAVCVAPVGLAGRISTSVWSGAEGLGRWSLFLTQTQGVLMNTKPAALLVALIAASLLGATLHRLNAAPSAQALADREKLAPLEQPAARFGQSVAEQPVLQAEKKRSRRVLQTKVRTRIVEVDNETPRPASREDEILFIGEEVVFPEKSIEQLSRRLALRLGLDELGFERVKATLLDNAQKRIDYFVANMPEKTGSSEILVGEPTFGVT